MLKYIKNHQNSAPMVAYLYENMMSFVSTQACYDLITSDFFVRAVLGGLETATTREDVCEESNQCWFGQPCRGNPFRMISFSFSFAFFGIRNNPNMEEFFYLCCLLGACWVVHSGLPQEFGEACHSPP